ncbi:MAG: hypothetical protein HS113_14290 [Verrucomicrobiales bacterium]|nr:hypothetical protein [Verrucomicrobiales bacterium]
MSDILNKATVRVLNRNWQAINARKGNRVPQEAAVTLLAVPCVPKELPAMALLRNSHAIDDWRSFLR